MDREWIVTEVFHSSSNNCRFNMHIERKKELCCTHPSRLMRNNIECNRENCPIKIEKES